MCRRAAACPRSRDVAIVVRTSTKETAGLGYRVGSTSRMADNVELVRRLWDAFERGGMEAVFEVVDPDVEWEPYGGGGVVYRGHDGLRAYMKSRAERNEEPDGRLYSAFAKGDCANARGEARLRGPQGGGTMTA